MVRVFGSDAPAIPSSNIDNDNDDNSMTHENWQEELKSGRFVVQVPRSRRLLTLAAWYSALQREQQQQQRSSSSEALTACLQIVATKLQQQVAALLQQQAVDANVTVMDTNTKAPWISPATSSTGRQQPQQQEEEEDLFGSFAPEPAASTARSQQGCGNGPVADFLQLVEQQHGAALQWMRSSSSSLSWTDETADAMLHCQLARIAQILSDSDSVPADSAMTRLTALSTLVNQSVAVRQAVGRAFLSSTTGSTAAISSKQKKKNHDDATTGRDLEQETLLQALWALAGYTLPLPAGTSSHTANLWKKQLQQAVPNNFPVGALAAAHASTIRSCMQQAGNLQQAAQRVALSVLRQVLKLSPEHKQAVFHWMRRVAVIKCVVSM